VHGLFNIPVFRSHVVTHGFPGPLVQTGKNKWVRWIDGKYIITHQKTRVDRSTIKTTIKRKRLPDPIPDEPAPKQTQESKDIIDFYI
jgi:hypothetical protein